MKNLGCTVSEQFEIFAKKHKLFWLDESKWNWINNHSWDNRVRVKYINHMNKTNIIYMIADKVLWKIGLCR